MVQTPAVFSWAARNHALNAAAGNRAATTKGSIKTGRASPGAPAWEATNSTSPLEDSRRIFAAGDCVPARETVRRCSRPKAHGVACPDQVSFVILNRIATSTNTDNQGIVPSFTFHSQFCRCRTKTPGSIGRSCFGHPPKHHDIGFP